MRKIRFREVSCSALGHTAMKQLRLYWNPALGDSGLTALTLFSSPGCLFVPQKEQ